MNQPAAPWTTCLPATDDAVASLVEHAPWQLPDEYLAYLRTSNGGEGDLDVQPCYAILWSAEEVLSNHAGYEVPQYAPGFLAFGSSGGGELIAFDMREAGRFPVVRLPCIGLAPSEAILVADSFADFTTHFGLPYTEAD